MRAARGLWFLELFGHQKTRLCSTAGSTVGGREAEDQPRVRRAGRRPTGAARGGGTSSPPGATSTCGSAATAPSSSTRGRRRASRHAGPGGPRRRHPRLDPSRMDAQPRRRRPLQAGGRAAGDLPAPRCDAGTRRGDVLPGRLPWRAHGSRAAAPRLPSGAQLPGFVAGVGRSPRPATRSARTIATHMNPIIDFINANRDRYLAELKTYLAIPSISALPEHAGDVRRCAEWTARELTRIGLQNVRLEETPGHPIVYGEWLRRAGRADHAVLRALRRAAGRPARSLGVAAVRADGPRRRDLRPRIGRRQGPDLHARQGDRGAPEAGGEAAHQREGRARGRGGGRQPEPRRLHQGAQGASSPPTWS